MLNPEITDYMKYQLHEAFLLVLTEAGKGVPGSHWLPNCPFKKENFGI